MKTQIEDTLRQFAQELDRKELEDILAGRELSGRNYRPERFTEEKLVAPIIETLGLGWEAQPHSNTGGGDRWADFELSEVDVDVIGEVKKVGKYPQAVSDLQGYLDTLSISAVFGIATDGLTWSLIHLISTGDSIRFEEVFKFDLRGDLRRVSDLDNGEDNLDAFIQSFQREGFSKKLTEDVKRDAKERQEKSVEEFYRLYIELLFGEGPGDHQYETTLISEVRQPYDVPEKDKKLFAVTLINRLLFIKFLEKTGVLPTNFLRERVHNYQKTQVAADLYNSQIQPVFYELFNTPKTERKRKHRTSWFADVPYLNGGLFREAIDKERQYSVSDGILVTIINDLIEGHELSREGIFDPSVIGRVFEKTITFLEDTKRQNNIGAYYTPDDVTELIVNETLRTEAKSILVEVFADHNNIAEAQIRSHSLEEIFRGIAEREGWFGNPEALKEADERLSELRCVDAACGSGHFLTTLAHQLFKLREGVREGLSAPGKPSPKKKYKLKCDIALNCIYGVDIEPAAVEIAKLRVWLKILEGNGWKPKFGALPNIDLNILPGNSLVGLPPIDSGEDRTLQFFDEAEEVQKLLEMRSAHKFENVGTKREVLDFQHEEVAPEGDRIFLEGFESPGEWHPTDQQQIRSYLAELTGAQLESDVSRIVVSDTHGDYLSDDQQDTLDWYGFKMRSKARTAWGRPDNLIAVVENNLGRGDRQAAQEKLLDFLRNLDDLRIEQMERYPTDIDLQRIEGGTFHWPLAFPEVVSDDGEMGFDVMVGNPPYGDLLGSTEKFLMKNYETANAGQIASPFVERQLKLLEDGGVFGNITASGLVNNNDQEGIRDVMESVLGKIRCATFTSRPDKIFSGADVRTAIFTATKSVDTDGYFETSECIRLKRNSRERQIKNIEYSDVRGLKLRESIGGTDTSTIAKLPKIGNSRNRDILEALSQHSRLIGDAVDDNGNETLWFRRSGRYWLCAMLTPLYDSTMIKELPFSSRNKKELTFLTIHSSLFYLYWYIYGNQRQLNKGLIKRFPLPDSVSYGQRFDQLRDRLSTAIADNFNEEKNQFNMQPVKPIIDDVDEYIGDHFGLEDQLVDYLQTYQSEYARNGDDQVGN